MNSLGYGRIYAMAHLPRRRVEPTVDYIVVGGGSTGCVLASRLSEDPYYNVRLLEEGPRDWNPYIHMPVTYYKTAKGPLLKRYAYQASPAQRLTDSPSMVQAKVLGGGSSVNAMLYVRGVAEDYDEWASLGATGWDFAGVLPYFRRAERNSRFANEAHGSDGPLRVSDQQYTHPLTKRWLQACQQAGLPFNPDFNGGDQRGCGLYQITASNGRRSSAAVAYLKQARKRRNLEISTGCRVVRIIVEQGRARGVEYIRDGRLHTLHARQEVIVSAGTINTTKLLMLSGIGPARTLQNAGVRVVQDLEGVGKNYQDHMEMSLVYRLSGAHSYDKYKKLGWKAAAGLEYALFGSGPVTSNVAEGGAFWQSAPDLERPDLQLFFLAGAGVEEGVEGVPGGNGCTISVTQTRPKSRGFIEIASNDVSSPPIINPNYLTDPHDIEVLSEGARLVQGIMEQPALRPYVAGPQVPGRTLETREDLSSFVREHAHPGLHPCGTCRMGSDEMSVVDPQLRVHGIENLRVADASVMPNVVSGNLNAVVIMIGEKASDIILGEPPATSLASDRQQRLHALEKGVMP